MRSIFSVRIIPLCGFQDYAQVQPSLQIAFRKVMADTHGHDLDSWRKSILSKRPSREYLEGFRIADMDDGAMWDLLKQLTSYDPSKRLTAAAALRHPAFGTGLIGRLNVLLSNVGNATDRVSFI